MIRASNATGKAGPPLRTGAIAAALGAAFFALYAARLCPDLCLFGDSGELVTAAATWGVPHAPGYPLWTLLGHAAAALPFGTVAWRVHLTSAVFHAGTVAATAYAAGVMARSRVAAVAAGIALGTARAFVLGSLYAEVFPLNDLFTALAFALAARLGQAGGPRDEPVARAATHSALGLFAVAGLAAAHHPMFVLAVPSIAILGWGPWIAASTWRQRAAWTAAVVLPPVIAYALVPLAAMRDPPISWNDVHDAASLFRLVTRADYGGPFSPARVTTTTPGSERVAALGGILVDAFGAPTLAAAAAGWLVALPRAPRAAAAILLAFALAGPTFAWMNAVDMASEARLASFVRFTTMCMIPLALAVAFAAAALAALARSRTRHGAAAVVALAAAWTAFALVRSRGVTLAGDRRAIAFAHDLVLGPPDGALVLVSGDEPLNAALYVCGVEKRCGARTVISPGTLSTRWRMAQVRRRHPDLVIPWESGPALPRIHELVAAALPGRPVSIYPALFSRDRHLDSDFDRRPEGLSFRVWPRGTAPAEPVTALSDDPGCEGCALPPTLRFTPSQDSQIVQAYEAAFRNHARAGAGPGAAADEARAATLRDALERRAR